MEIESNESMTEAAPAVISLPALAVAAIGGIISAMLMVDVTEMGLNAIVLAAFWLGVRLVWLRQQGDALDWQQKGLMGLALFFALTFFWRDSPVLHGLSTLSLMAIVVLAFQYQRTGSILHFGVVEWMYQTFTTPRTALRQSRASVASLKSVTEHTAGMKSVLRGALMGLPILLLFAALLAGSDERFQRVLNSAFDWDGDDFVQYLFFFAVGFVAFVAALYRTQLGDLKPYRQSAPKKVLGHTEILTMLSMVNGLFLTYVLVQFSYFFGGDAFIGENVQATYSSYARAGFFELVVLALLVLPMLLALHWYQVHQAESRLSVALWWSVVATVGLLMLIEVSAIYRMVLYTSAYGLTELRFYSTMFMFWLIVLLLALPYLITRDRLLYVPFAIGVAMLMVVVLQVINPDALITRYNVTDSERPDVAYTERYLSADAVPIWVENLKPPHRCQRLARLAYRFNVKK